MTELRLETLEMPAAALGLENPLPPLHAYRTVSITETSEAAVETPAYSDRGNEAGILPYRLQDNYDRHRSLRRFKTAVLENDILRATFLLDFGGRLWSLYHKPTGRELLHVNPVFQPANLAVRDAWFSGGVEWNLSIIGHCPFTCAPLFAARVKGDDGTPILRFYEYERIRQVPFQIDFHLPGGSSYLFVRPRISNPNPHAIPMYWWSNIAVEEAPGVRVIAPADSGYFHDYDRTLKSHDLPMRNGEDMTYPRRRASAADLYFRIRRDRRPWIAAVDISATGMIHTSTQRLCGRKMFLWGMDPGGRRWQEYLSEPGQHYIEIQGGLATTQTEYVAMPAGAQWEWLEAYGGFDADAGAVHNDWPTAIAHIEAKLEQELPRAEVESRLADWRADADRAPAEILQTASGWGALERRRREKAGLLPMESLATPFADESLGEEQQPWRDLLERGEFPYGDPSNPPGAYMTDPAWRVLLEEAIAAGRGVHWLSLLHLGIMRYRAGDLPGARQAWERSLALEQSAWSYRNLAVLEQDEGNPSRAAELWAQAAAMKPDLAALAIEACQAMLAAGQYAALRQLIARLCGNVAASGRIRLITTLAALRCGDLAAPAAFFSAPCDIANIREGELSLSDLWFEWHEARLAKEQGVPIDGNLRARVREEYPLPREFDFRMKPD
ncbi:MAG TPA: DUF5107 domain-containing protein [Tepidisphaeraceae bacterium]|jgi:tetratricopeptide (TPR) repeat protein|nr:DUF5107 domain-containing protein [Tepidisphaeraceae bacterium]